MSWTSMDKAGIKNKLLVDQGPKNSSWLSELKGEEKFVSYFIFNLKFSAVLK